MDCLPEPGQDGSVESAPANQATAPITDEPCPVEFPGSRDRERFGMVQGEVRIQRYLRRLTSEETRNTYGIFRFLLQRIGLYSEVAGGPWLSCLLREAADALLFSPRERARDAPGRHRR